MIDIKKVSKKFTKKISKKETQTFYADKDITINAKEGEIVGLLGPNGAGKTTLLRMLAGIMEPDEGTIQIENLNYKDDALLTMCGEYYKVEKNELENRIKEITKRFNLNDFLHQRIENLSTGQLQRVNIARCVVHNPKYYIFDEATSGLDIISSKVILDFIKEEKQKNKCIIYSTHYMEEAENICDRVVLVHKGHIIKEGTPNSIMKETKTTNLRDAFFILIGGETFE